MDEAAQPGGLLAGLDTHREYLKSLAGFRDIRITRSINNEGNVLVVVETRWSDDTSLVRYETGEDNVAAIVRKHSNVIVPNTLQVLDMEALRTESSFTHGEAAENANLRTILPIAIPLAALAGILLVVYGLSRIYLDLGGDSATILAAGLAIGVLFIATYFAVSPNASGFLIAAVFMLVSGVFVGGVIWALLEDDPTHSEAVEEPGGEEPGEGEEEPGGESPAPGGDIVVLLKDNVFEFEGEEDPAIPVASGEEVVFSLTNEGAAIHNMTIAGEDGELGTDDDVTSDPDTIRAGDEGTLTWTPPAAGTYDFQCDFHVSEMIGTIVVE